MGIRERECAGSGMLTYVAEIRDLVSTKVESRVPYWEKCAAEVKSRKLRFTCGFFFFINNLAALFEFGTQRVLEGDKTVAENENGNWLEQVIEAGI